jgi:hypothetical protein
MNRVLSIVGAAALLVAAVFGTAFGIQAWNARTLDAESKAFVDEAVPAITAHWDKQVLLDKAAQSARRGLANAPEFADYSRLGALVEYDGAIGSARRPTLFGGGPLPVASYKAKAKFQNGDVTLHVFVAKRDGEWRILFFNIEGWKRLPLAQS